MTNVSALQALNAAVAATKATATNSGVDFSSYLNTSKSLNDIYKEASQTYGVYEELLKAMTKQESNFNPNATSRSGAQGLMQLMPATAAELGVKNAYDPYENIMGGAKYIRRMLDKYNGNVSLALAAYNAGSSAVDKYGGIPPYEETQTYVAKITRYLEEGVDVPDTGTMYQAQSTFSKDTGVTYEELNAFAGAILTEIFSYEDYMQFLSSAAGKDEKKLTLEVNTPASSQSAYEVMRNKII